MHGIYNVGFGVHVIVIHKTKHQFLARDRKNVATNIVIVT